MVDCEDSGKFCYLMMTDNEDIKSIESRGCDRNQEFPGHYSAVAEEENKRCFHFNDGKRCLCNYDRCNNM